MSGWNSVFTGYYELIDSIAATCLGNDGTQVGIYGGLFPFDPRVTGLNIRRLDVAKVKSQRGYYQFANIVYPVVLVLLLAAVVLCARVLRYRRKQM